MKNQETIILEIRASEGGSDSKMLVEDLRDIYLKSARNNGFDYKITQSRSGFCVIWLTGSGVKKYYKNEGGGHRFLRTPPTEKRGRIHTSVITVAVTIPSDFKFELDRSNVTKSYIRSSKKGGQNVNKVSSCVQLTDNETGIQVKVMDTRDQNKNEEIAWQRLEDKIKSIHKDKYDKSVYDNRFNQVGNSSRSVKRRTYRIKEDSVVDHETNKSCSFRDFSRGRIELVS